MKRISIISFWLALLLLGSLARGQQSANTVKYTVTYDAGTQTYTAYVVPDYSVPNSNNGLVTERGATAQYSIVVPKDFVITQVTDIKGTWAKASELLKLGPGQPGQDWSGYNLNPGLNYYIIGKAPAETDYGPFVPGQRVALFSFKGNGCFGLIYPLAPGDPFINAADQSFALNVANSFTSRSGQPAGGNELPLEQFVNNTGTAANCSPVPVLTANPDNATITAGSTATTPVLANDTNTGQPATTANATVSITTQPTVGTVVVNPDGTISFTAPAAFAGTVCYAYQICDLTSTTACSAPAQVCVTVQAVVPPKVLTANPDNATITAGSTATTPVLANDTNTGQLATTANVTVSITTQPTVGTVTVNPDGTISFTPPATFTGTVCYAYSICDLTSATACSAPAQVCVTVQAVVPPKVLTANPDNATITAGSTATTPVLANDTNTGQPATTANATVSITTQPTVGTVVVNPDGTISFTPPANFTGTVCYAYSICDLTSTTACSAPAQVCVTVQAVVPPKVLTANPDNATITAGSTATTPVLANDTNTGQPATTANVTVSITTQPTVGTVVVNPDGTISFTPPATFAGTVCYAYSICDLTSTTACSAPAQVCVTVQAVVPPKVLTANPDNATITAGSTAITPVLANDTNTGQPATTANATVSITTQPTVGMVTVNPDGTISFTPPASFTGTVCYAYNICDLTSTTACSAPAQVCVLVRPKPPGSADISIVKRVAGNKQQVLGGVVTFQIVVRNLGPDAATNVVVKDSLASGLLFQSASVAGGSYSNPLLTIPALASGDSVVLTVLAKVLVEGISFNYARVISLDQTDPNAANDTDQTCASVPVNLCTGETIVANVPAPFTDVTWYKAGVVVATGNTVTLTEGGTYTFTASNSTCPAEGCCPLIIVQTDCCPANACVPFVITRTRRK